MKGWLTVRSGPLLLSADRYFFRLQWGFLSQYEGRRAEALHRYCIHAATLDLAETSRKIVLTIGPLGVLTAHGTDRVMRAGERGGLFSKRRKEEKGAGTRMRADDVSFTPARERKPTRLVLVADTVEEFRLWALLLERGRVRPIARRFLLREAMGEGSAGQVFRATAVHGPFLEVAVKRVEYNLMREGAAERNLRRLQKEVQTQVKAASRSPCVVNMLDVFFDSRYVYLVMELVHGGSLREWLDDHGPVDDGVAVSIAQQLTRCILILHQNHIVHRDVKTDNVLLEVDENGNMSGARLTDFGFAEVCRNGDMNTFCTSFLGTASYMATEIAWFDKYGAPVDMYALGVLCFVVLTGQYPFDADGGLIEQIAKIKKADRTPIIDDETLTPDAKSFCLALTNEDPRKRLTAAAALQHRWLRRGRNVTVEALTSPSRNRGGKAWFRRAFHVISAVHAMRSFTRTSRPIRLPLSPDVAEDRLAMLRRLDSKNLPQQPVPRQSVDFREEDDGEVFVGDDSHSGLRALLAR